ncbi:glycosyltransferase family 4 protein [Fluoribacter gormanii]|uniref:GDP-mannose-dependent alpha-(1-6)-phosphatidylinositol monomannoside mannosyltransferase n=1 Tax=Fluoribacter gormanii TaxID=464 RepID=A0A377GF37_9GAMM|nr:glycosyltransferase family 4 protein [Fluoribacter gormanii]KTD04606.1 glycosyl transferase, group 1 [Fluoribacter gormanii]MCW8445046.1 glycosyltransferase family 4 protein [Fluoribacter gormanii]SIR33390.1 Glycosyltransferase involved in cell wall bisynthesis [Fluoribacter gormanii]STO23388.1 GDP-mannose-dependent alpha-(1-6)-phosphatidylinositol monomannoside mannosyltransferase [Fluoribacter gormanii]
MSSLKICYILSTTEGGTWAFEQLRELRNTYQYDVSVILSGTSGTLVDRFRAENIPVYTADFDFMRPTDLFLLPQKILRLVNLLRQKRFDVIQTHLFPSMVIGRIASWIADVPIRLSMIAGPFHLEADTPQWIDKTTSWMDVAVIPSCNYSKQLYLKMGVPEHRLHVIYYSPDERRFDAENTLPAGLREEFGWPAGTPLIGMIAYFYPKLGKNRWTPPFLHGKAIKGHEDVIRAAPTILKEFPNAKLLLIGSGWGEAGQEVMQSMQALVAELGLQDSVIFTGHRQDIPRIYRDLDVSIQASLNENLGGTIEALLMECPTVVTRVGGLVDTVIDGATGVQVNVADPADLAEGVLRLLRDPKAAKKLGEAGRAYMLEKFTLNSTVSDLDKLYQHYIKKTPTGYRFYKTIYRFLLLSVLGFFVSLRFFILDIWLLPRWDMGWRPWKQIIIRSKMLLYRFYSLAGQVAAKISLKSKD